MKEITEKILKKFSTFSGFAVHFQRSYFIVIIQFSNYLLNKLYLGSFILGSIKLTLGSITKIKN